MPYKEYYYAHRKKLREDYANFYRENPWMKHYKYAKYRSLCPQGDYFGKIKFSLTPEDIKELWFRDKAWLLKQPSIDRINNGDYRKDKCRFIEWSENARLGVKEAIKNYKRNLTGQFISNS